MDIPQDGDSSRAEAPVIEASIKEHLTAQELTARMKLDGVGERLTARSVLVGLAIGTLMCMSNTYFGLQTGWITMGSLQSAILGFGAFKTMQFFGFGRGFTVSENVIVQTTSVATATMPLAAGFVAVIPAMSQLSKEQNPPDGPYIFGDGQLILWALMLAFFGIFVAVPLRTQVIEREKLRFPSGTATANVIRVLHSAEQTPAARGAASRVTGRSVAAGELPRHRPPPPSASSSSPPVPLRASTLERSLVGGGAWSESTEIEMSSSLRSSAALEDWQGRSVCPRRLSAASLRVLEENGNSQLAQGSPVPSGCQRLASATASPSHDDAAAGMDLASIRTTWFALGSTFSLSFGVTAAVAVLDAHKIPSALPIFGSAAGRWGWKLAPYVGYVGQGMIMGPRVTASMLAGAVFAFGILGPYAVHMGWSPPHLERVKVGDHWEDGSKAWLTWVSLAIMITDSLTSLAIIAAKYAVSAAQRRARNQQNYTPFDAEAAKLEPTSSKGPPPQAASPPGSFASSPYPPPGGTDLPPPPVLGLTDTGALLDGAAANSSVEASGDRATACAQAVRGDEQIPGSLWAPGLVVSSVAAVAVLSPMFGMPVWELAMSIGMAILVAVLAVRALGETDLNPVSGIGKLSQIAFAACFPGKILPNLVAGALAEASAQQAGDMMQDFKTAHLLGVCPRMQFYAMAIGSCASCFVSTGAYLLYSSVYEIGGAKLPAPTAKVWLYMADLVNGGSLPKGVVPFCYLGGVLGIVLAALPDMLTFLAGSLPLQHPVQRAASATLPYLPSGIGFAIGMFITPDFTLPRVIGSVVEQLWLRLNPRSHHSAMLIAATGFVLGDGIASMLATIVKALS